MKLMLIKARLLIAVASIFMIQAMQKPDIADLAITNVTLIDGTGSAAKENVTILIKDGRFLEITESQEITTAEIMDGTGKYGIPGLFDNHVHLGYDSSKFQRQMNQFLHFGVTTILVPGADNRKLLDFKAKVKEENLSAPNIYHTSLMTTIEGAHPIKTYASSNYIEGKNINIIREVGDIKGMVEQAVEDDAIAMKLMIEDGPMPPFIKRIPEEFVSEVSKRARDADLQFFAHVSDMYEVKTAVNNGADALMHFMGVQIDWNSESDLDAVRKIAENEISWVTTSMIGKSFYYPLNKEWIQNDQFKVYDPDQIGYFGDVDGSQAIESKQILTALFRSEQIPPMQTIMAPGMRSLKKIHDMGGNIVVGSDVRGRPYILPGISMHEEMEILALGGFSPEQIIQCATLNAARMLQIEDNHGSVEKGKYADLVLLSQNPLDDISNTLSIELVLKEGIPQNRIEKN